MCGQGRVTTMELTSVQIILLLVAQGVLSLAMAIGLVALALRGSRQLQDRLLFHSKTLNRFAKHVLSDNYQTAMSSKIREALRRELLAELAAEREALAEREQALMLAQTALAAREAALAERSATGDVLLLTTGAERELAELEQAVLAPSSELESSALLAEIADLRQHLAQQDAELHRLRSQLSSAALSREAETLLDAQRKQLEQYQRMQRDMDMCIQVMESELAQTRQTLQKVLKRLREQTERNQQLSRPPTGSSPS